MEADTVIVTSQRINGTVHFQMTVKPDRYAQIDHFFAGGPDQAQLFPYLVSGADKKALEMASASMVAFFMQILKVIAAFFRCKMITLDDTSRKNGYPLSYNQYLPPDFVSWFGGHFGFLAAVSSKLSIDDAVEIANSNREANKQASERGKTATVHEVSNYFALNPKMQDFPIDEPNKLCNVMELAESGDYEVAFDKEQKRFVKRLLPHRGFLAEQRFVIRHPVEVALFIDRTRQFEHAFHTLLKKGDLLAPFLTLDKKYAADMLVLDRSVYAFPPDTQSIHIYAECVFTVLDRYFGDLIFSIKTADAMSSLMADAISTLDTLTYNGQNLVFFLTTWAVQYIDHAIADMADILTTKMKRVQMNFHFLDMAITLLNAQFVRERVPFYNGPFVIRSLVHFPPQSTDFFVRVAEWAKKMKQVDMAFYEQGDVFEEQFRNVLIRATGLNAGERKVLFY